MSAEQQTLVRGVCPFCGARQTMQCRCRRSDMKCQNGHEWHYDGDQIHAGSSDHGSPKCCPGVVIAVVDRTLEQANSVAKRFAKTLGGG